MARTPVQQGQDARRFDEALANAAVDQERQTSFVATALFSKRADGHIEPISATEAAQLLGSIDSYHTGQGSYNYLVPVQKITALGLNSELWEKAATQRAGNYDLDALTGTEFISRLEVLSGKTLAEQRALKKSVDDSRGDKSIA